MQNFLLNVVEHWLLRKQQMTGIGKQTSEVLEELRSFKNQLEWENRIKPTMRFLDKVVPIPMREITQGKMEVPNNEAIKITEIKLSSLNSRNRLTELSVRSACGHAWETKFTRLLFKVRARNPPKFVSYNQHLPCSKHHAISTSKVSFISINLKRAITCLYRFCVRELRELVKANIYTLKSLIKFQTIKSALGWQIIL